MIPQDIVIREMLWANDGPDTMALSLLLNLIKYGKENCNFVILEGILNSKWYKKLFENIKTEFGSNIYAYYYDIPFEETLLRHKTRANCNEFGENEMKSWWNEKDYLDIIKEKIITKDIDLDKTVEMIFNDVIKEYELE